MKIILSAAMSRDGYLDDASPQRRVLSCPKDLREVAKLRARADAILVGAETVRKDNPSLVTRSRILRWKRKARNMAADPLKVTITRSGCLDPDSKFFREGSGGKVVYSAGAACKNLANFATIVPVTGIPAMLADLEKRGIKTLLVEGGVKILDQFLAMGNYDEFRLAIASTITIGDARAPCLCGGSLSKAGRAIRKEECGDMEIIHFVPSIRT